MANFYTPFLWPGPYLRFSPIPSLAVFLLCIFFCRCSSNPSPPPSPSPPQTFTWQQFCSRDQGNPTERLTLYRAKVPTHWVRKEPFSKDSISDSTLPNCEFFIGKDPSVYFALHTFPTDTFEQRIPAEAQIDRWKRQFEEIDLTSIIITPRALGGFIGLSFYASGTLKGQEHAILSYSMQLAQTHWRTLQSEDLSFKKRQMASDYTLKAIGSPESLAKYKEEIERFANSFELIEEIPVR